MSGIQQRNTESTELGPLTLKRETTEEKYFKILGKSDSQTFGKYQVLVFVTFIMAHCSFGYIIYVLPFLELFPQFNCEVNGEWVQDCSSEQICASDPPLPYIVDYNNSTSLHNWVETLDLTCVSSAKLGMIGSSFFIGWTSGTLIIPPLFDKFGRKWPFRICCIVSLAAMTCIAFSRSLDFTIVMMTVCGFCTSGRISVGYIYAAEFLSPKKRVLYATILLFADNLSGWFSAIYFKQISKYAIYYELIGILMLAVSIVLHFIFISESPIWELKSDKTALGIEHLRHIVETNGVTDCDEDIEELENAKLRNTNISEQEEKLLGIGEEAPQKEDAKFFLKQSKILANLVLMSYIWAGVSFTSYLFSIYLKYLPGNIFVNSITSQTTQTLAALCGGVIYVYLGLKPTFSLLFAC